MALNFKRKVVLCKIEAVYGTDIAPANADAVQMRDVSINPLAGERIERSLVNASLGARAKLLVGRHVTLTCKVELGAGGAAGTAPGWDTLMRICGHSKTVDVGVDVEYKPIDSGYESASLYFNIDGQRHKMVGVRGGLTAFRIIWGQLPELEFNLIGIWSEDASAALPAADYSAWQAAIPVTKANTPLYTVDGYTAVAESLELKQQADVAYLERINRAEVPIRDRNAYVDALIEAPPIATKNFFSMPMSGASVVFAFRHGVAAGQQIQLDIPQYKVEDAQWADSKGDAMLQLTGCCLPGAGALDYTITVK